MKKNIVLQPFGILFEETALSGVDNEGAIYDEELDMNIILTPDGRKIPCVEMANILQQGTKTLTRQDKEASDSDDTINSLGTKTATSVTKEQSDSDSSFFLGTKTATKSSGESSDSDDENYI